MPYISTEALVGAALVVVLAFGYQYLPANGADGGASAAAKKSKKKNKKNKSKGGGADEPVSVATSEIESDAPIAGKAKGKGKGKHKAVAVTQQAAAAKQAPAGATPQPQTGAEPKAEPAAPPSFAAAAGGSSAPVTQPKPKTLAEKLVPKPRKTKVDDMLEPEDRAPGLARVMKITPSGTPSVHPSSVKVESYEDDYAESTSEYATDDTSAVRTISEDDGWNVVAAKKKPVSIGIGSGSSSGGVVHDTYDGHTKLQRKNQKKAEAKKAAKADAEADRLRRLAMHKRDLERAKINEIYSQQKKVVKQHGKVIGGGATASLDNGKLVWD